jgi:hypothetical protein
MPYLYAIRGKGKTHSASFPSNPVRGNQRERTKGQSRVKIFQHHNQFIQISARAAQRPVSPQQINRRVIIAAAIRSRIAARLFNVKLGAGRDYLQAMTRP